MARRVVVGWNGSTAAAAALDWAARHAPEAKSLEIVEVETNGRRRGEPHHDPEEAADRIRTEHPDMAVTVAKERGDVARVLAERSSPDGLVALGGRGHEETRLVHRSSMAYRTVLAAEGPVAVVPESYRGGHDVVVGVGGPADAPCVALLAAAEAARRHQKLIAVHVARPLFGMAALPGDIVKQDRDEQERTRMLEEVLRPVEEAYPNLRITWRVMRGRPSDVLLAESRSAMLMVLGRHPTPPENGHPVTHSSMLLSRSPVLVVPPETEVA